MKLEKKQLPKGWKVKKLGAVCKINPKLPNKDQINSELEVQFLPMKLVEEVVNKISLTETRTFIEVKKRSYTPFIDEDIIFAKVTPCMENGKIAVVKNLKNGIGFGSSEFHVVRCSESILSKFVFYFLVRDKFRNEAASEMTGAVGLRRVPKQFIENYSINLPPLPEQQAIVVKIEELFSQLESGKQQLLTAQKQLKTYRQSLLKWAFEGKLTNQNLKAGELPKGWEVTELQEICEIKRGKSKHRPRNDPSLFGGKYPFIQTGDIRNADGGYIRKFNQTYSEKGLQQSRLWTKGTLCITIAANIGETAILDLDACFPDSVVGLICNEKFLLNKYAHYFFISHKSKLEQLAPATAQKNINVDILEKVKIPLPQINEQQQIVDDIESKLTICNKIEETINTSLRKAETLRQSILKKAFEGELIKPKQETAIYKPHNEYFYQMQLMGYVLAISKQKKIEHGEMTSAKYIYLIDRVYGIPTFYEFKRGHLGPFPAAIKKAINNKQYFKKTAGHLEVINENTLFKSVNPYTEKTKKAVSELTDFFSKYNAKDRAHKTELLATICKVIEDIQSTELKMVRKSMEEWLIELKNHPNSTKAAKFSEEETAKCLQFIIEKGWDQKILQKK